MSHVAELRESRKRDGFRVIAVVVPLSEEEQNTQFVSESIARLNLTEPCAIDIEYQLSKAFDCKLETLPAYYLIDIDGRVRIVADGDNGVSRIEDELDQMLAQTS